MEKPVAERIGVNLLLDLYRRMLELREFELKVQELYRRGLLPGFVHLYIGEEAVGVGVCSNLEPKDLVYSTHRGHGHALAKGVPARQVLADRFRLITGSWMACLMWLSTFWLTGILATPCAALESFNIISILRDLRDSRGFGSDGSRAASRPAMNSKTMLVSHSDRRMSASQRSVSHQVAERRP